MTKKEAEVYEATGLEELFSELPEEEVLSLVTPSNRKVTIRPLTFEDEKIIAKSQKRGADTGTTALLERCVTGEDIPSLLLIDKLYLILKIREISFGNEYKITLICNNCNVENDLAIELNKLEVKNLPVPDNLTLSLPILKKECIFRRAEISDEIYLKNEDTLFSNLWRFIKKLGKIEDQALISAAINRIPIADIHLIIKSINSTAYGLQTKVKYACNSCSTDQQVTLPITEDFFSVS